MHLINIKTFKYMMNIARNLLLESENCIACSAIFYLAYPSSTSRRRAYINHDLDLILYRIQCEFISAAQPKSLTDFCLNFFSPRFTVTSNLITISLKPKL